MAALTMIAIMGPSRFLPNSWLVVDTFPADVPVVIEQRQRKDEPVCRLLHLHVGVATNHDGEWRVHG